MEGWQRWLGLGAGLGVIYALVPKAIEQQQAEPAPAPALERLSEAPAPSPEPPAEPDFSGLDLLRLDLQSDRVTSPLSHGRTAELTLDPQLQRETLDSAMKDLEAQVARLNPILTTRVPALNRALDAAGVPWTAGRPIK